MKRVRTIRNILIALIVIIALTYMFFIRSTNINTSKAFKVFHDFSYIENTKSKQATMQLKYKDNNIKTVFVFGSDYQSNQEVNIVDVCYSKDKENRTNTITIMGKNQTKSFFVFPNEKKYKVVTDSSQKTEVYTNWCEIFENQLFESNYYTRGYELVNGKICYYENFKNSGMTLYFDNNNLRYMKNKKLDESFDNVSNALYNVEIIYDDTYNKYIEVLDNYTEIIEEES